MRIKSINIPLRACLKRSGKALLLFNLLLTTACSSKGGVSNLFPSAGDNPIRIESDPPAAEVYVMGEKIGVTPLQIRHKDVFPNIYPKEKESVYGRVLLKKAGCLDFIRTVSTEISDVGLHARLDCGGMTLSMPGVSGDKLRSSDSIEQRLNKIKDLLNKGLITEEEAKKAREHVINDL